MPYLNQPPPPRTLAVGLGANLPSKFGPPHKTLNAVRPALEEEIKLWLIDETNADKTFETPCKDLRFRWSPLFGTEPIGGPPNQPEYINTVLVVDGQKLFDLEPTTKAAISLLERFLNLEIFFGRDRNVSAKKWSPRSLDLDLLAWGDLQVKTQVLTLPHPRLIERSFVVVPLAAALTSDIANPRIMPKGQNWIE